MAYVARGYGGKVFKFPQEDQIAENLWGYNDSAHKGASRDGSGPRDRSESSAGNMVAGVGALLMEKGSYPVNAVSIQERSVEAVRKAIQELKGSFPIFDISLLSFGFSSDPEGRARLGITMNQLSASQKDRMIIGCGPEIGRIPDPGQTIRREITRLGIAKGFAWVEYDIDLDVQSVKGLRRETIKTGSRLLVRMDPSVHTQQDIENSLWGCDGIKISQEITKRSDIDTLAISLDLVRKLSPNLPIFIRPRGRYGQMLQSLSWLFRSCTMCIDPATSPEMDPSQSPRNILEYSQRVNRVHLGLREDLRTSSFSMNGITISPSTEFAFLLGHPVQHSLEPILHNRAFRSEGSNCLMLPIGCGMDAIDAGIDLLRDMGSIGASVTLPIRSQIGRKLDKLDDQAKRLGAVNTIKVEGRKLIGFNTEYQAATDVLGKYVSDKGSIILILGTGGAGRSIAAASSDMGFRTYLYGSNQERTLQIARSIGGGIGAVGAHAVSKLKGKVAVLVNATPEGAGKLSDRAEGKLGVSEIARTIEPSFGIDLIYSPPWTSFLSSIESRGGVPVSGFEMLVAEVGRSHLLWTGRSPRSEELKLCAMEAHPIIVAS